MFSRAGDSPVGPIIRFAGGVDAIERRFDRGRCEKAVAVRPPKGVPQRFTLAIGSDGIQVE
jgi:hypothetical protein